MTEKRFTIQGRGISDHKRKRLYDLETIDGFISLREVLNELEKENEKLKEFKKRYDELLFEYNNRACELEDLQNELASERQYILYLKSVLEDNEIWYDDGDFE